MPAGTPRGSSRSPGAASSAGSGLARGGTPASGPRLGVLLLRDPAPARSRAIALARPQSLAGADEVWVRQGAGSWQRLPLLRRQGPTATPVAGSRPGVLVERRRGVIGEVAVVTLEAEEPIAARIVVAGRTTSTRAGYFASEVTLRVPLGPEPPARLPVEWWGLDGRPQRLLVDLEAPPDRSIRATPVDWRPASQAVLEEFAGRSWLVLETSAPVRLEIRAPARSSRRSSGGGAFLARGGSGTPGRTGTGGLDLHSGMAGGDWTGLQACLQCHPKAADHGASHPLVQARSGGGYALPEELPLGSRGQILCSTCHEPHGSGGHTFLARLDPRRELCIQCHVEVR